MQINDWIEKIVGAIIKLKEDRRALKKLTQYMRISAAILILLSYAYKKIGLDISCYVHTIEIRDLINRVIIWAVLVEIIHRMVTYFILQFLIGRKRDQRLYIPLIIDDLVDFSCSAICACYAINRLGEAINEIGNENICDIVIASIYLGVLFITWVCEQNYRNYCENSKEYTDYYDVKGKRIPKNSYVIYYGMRYQVLWTGDILRSIDNEFVENRWVLIPDGINDGHRKEISLEKAVLKRDGNLMLCEEAFD